MAEWPKSYYAPKSMQTHAGGKTPATSFWRFSHWSTIHPGAPEVPSSKTGLYQTSVCPAQSHLRFRKTCLFQKPRSGFGVVTGLLVTGLVPNFHSTVLEDLPPRADQVSLLSHVATGLTRMELSFFQRKGFHKSTPVRGLSDVSCRTWLSTLPE